MIILLVILALLASLLLMLVSFVQLLYLESLRLRTRELPALTFFKETLEDRIGLKADLGALPFSLLKHSLLVGLGVLMAGLAAEGGPLTAGLLFEACFFGGAVMLVMSYIMPQMLYRRTMGAFLLPLVPVLSGLAVLVRPITLILIFLESLVKLGAEQSAASEAATSAEEIEALITVGAEEGILEEDDRKLIQSVVALKDKTVRESMTPRPNMVAIPVDRSLEDLRQLVIHEQYSRVPVFEGTIDHIIGFVHVRDLFELTSEQQSELSIRDLVRPVKFVPESKPVDDLLREMQRDGSHMAVVVDEYGNTAGLSTMEDLVEEIVGEIRDEHEPDRDVHKDAEGVYTVAGSFDIDRLNDLLGLRVQDETESTTVGGLVTEWLGHVPHPGEVVDREGIHIEVLAANDLRVDQVRISKSEENAHV